MKDRQALYDAVLEGDAAGTRSLVTAALSEGENPQSLLDNDLIPAMDEVGRRFEEGKYFVPEMLIASRAMKAGLEIICPHLTLAERKSAGKVAVGTVIGDLHYIGKNLVVAMLEALELSGLRPNVKVMVGGAPITQRYADEIGADGYGDNASSAVRLARELAAA